MKNHILAEITFGIYPDNADQDWYDEMKQAFYGLMGNLPRCGQILGEWTQGVVDGELKAFVELPAADSLEEKYMSKYGLNYLVNLQALFGRAPEIKILTSKASAEPLADWRTAEWLVLYISGVDGVAPIRDQDCSCLPSYLLPIDADEMERLCFWARSQDRHERIWFASASLEPETYVALASPHSRLNLDAKQLTERLEKATRKPTYRYLFRHYALPNGAEENRLCPGCGSEWKVENERFAFRCEPCRLISDIGPDDEDENNWAVVGTWQTPQLSID